MEAIGYPLQRVIFSVAINQ